MQDQTDVIDHCPPPAWQKLAPDEPAPLLKLGSDGQTNVYPDDIRSDGSAIAGLVNTLTFFLCLAAIASLIFFLHLLGAF